MEKSGKNSLLVCVTVIVSVGIVTYGFVSFGKSIERSCHSLRDGMIHGSKMSIPSNINFKLSSSSIEKASKNIAEGMKNTPRIHIPSTMYLNLTSGNNGEFKVNLNKTGNP